MNTLLWFVVSSIHLCFTFALIIPTLNSVRNDISSGERRVAERLNEKWGKSTKGLVWFQPMIGENCLQPDLVVLDPKYGLVVMEVKEWKRTTIVSCHPHVWKLHVNGRDIQAKNPLLQARQYAQAIGKALETDPCLVHPPDHRYAGRLCIPYGYGVVFTNLSEGRDDDILGMIDERFRLCRNDLRSEAPFPWRRMLNYRFGESLHQSQLHKIRGIMFPELVIRGSSLERHHDNSKLQRSPSKPQGRDDRIFRIMNPQQELVARSLGTGHRVIHGVSGSGKTLILQCRVHYLAQTTEKPILVLCYNKVLAKKIESDLLRRGRYSNVKVYTFHQWCRQLLVDHDIPLPRSCADGGKYAEQLFVHVTAAIKGRLLPEGQYHSILVDEVHDFAPEWIALVTKQVSPETRSLLLVYDDAQRLYSHRGSTFSLQSVGVSARGRTTVLQMNYRNTYQIVSFAFAFIEPYLQQNEQDLLTPASIGRKGRDPVVLTSFRQESDMVMICKKLLCEGFIMSDIALLCRTRKVGDRFRRTLERNGLDCRWAGDTRSPDNRIMICTMHSSKGLEFPVVFIPAIDQIRTYADNAYSEAKLLYVAMTRATDRLYLLKGGADSLLSAQLAEIRHDQERNQHLL